MDPVVKILDRLGEMSKPRLGMWLLAVVLLVGYLDFLTNDHLSLSVLYLPLISLCCWYAGLNSAIWFSLLCSLLWLVDDLLVPEIPPPDAVKYWHTVVRFITFTAFAVVLSHLQQSLLRERQLARRDALTGL